MVGGDFLSRPRPCMGCSAWDIYIYVHVCVCVCVCMCIYIYICVCVCVCVFACFSRLYDNRNTGERI
jgi:hypothetical protein